MKCIVICQLALAVFMAGCYGFYHEIFFAVLTAINMAFIAYWIYDA